MCFENNFENYKSLDVLSEEEGGEEEEEGKNLGWNDKKSDEIKWTTRSREIDIQEILN